MPKCSFCGCEVQKGFGTLYATKTGDVFWYCSSKCERNKKLGRSANKLGWIRKSEAAKQKAGKLAKKTQK